VFDVGNEAYEGKRLPSGSKPLVKVEGMEQGSDSSEDESDSSEEEENEDPKKKKRPLIEDVTKQD